MSWLQNPALKWFVPLPILAALAPVVWLFFRGVWRELEEESLTWRLERHRSGQVDWRPLAAAVLGAVVLTLQEYFGGHAFFDSVLRAAISRWELSRPGGLLDAGIWSGFYGHAWWGLTRVGGYLLPFALWKLLFPGDQLRDYGLRTRGLRLHLWIYALCVSVVVPLLVLVRRQPDFGSYYPFYKQAGRSWLDFALWESIYLAQFLTLELFFRGWWIRAMRSLGVSSIFIATIPYCMIHYGKPYFEAMGAMVAGVVLGSLAVKTRGIWAGFLAHATVAVLMDVLTLQQRRSLPVLLAPGSAHRFSFEYWGALWWLAWFAALAVLGWHLYRRWPELTARWRLRSTDSSRR